MSGPDDLDPVVRPERQRRQLAEWPLASVLVAVLAGLLFVAAGRFRAGTVVLALSVLLAAALRAGLSTRTAGLLAVRSRVVDAVLLGVLGLGMLVLALIVPEID